MADHALALGGSTYPLSGNLHYSTQEPYGVVARMVSFNHPLFFAAGKVAAPLVGGNAVGGNAVVVKAPDQTPFVVVTEGRTGRSVFGPDLCAGQWSGSGERGRAGGSPTDPSDRVHPELVTRAG